MIEIIPAIDIIGGHCVRLSQGEYGRKKVYDVSPREMASRFADCGVRRIHLVDLDGAKASKPMNIKVLEEVSSLPVEIEWGGGISSEEALESVFETGATHAIIGSVAAMRPQLFSTWLEKYGKRMILGADIRDGKVAVKGWSENSGIPIRELLNSFNGLAEVICTDISKDGMLEGPSFMLYKQLKEEFPQLSLTVSGGISGMDDLRKLDALGLRKVIIGKAIYENRITLEEIRQWSQNA